MQRVWSKIRSVWIPLLSLPILWAQQKTTFTPIRRLWFFTCGRTFDILRAVERYDPKFEQNIKHIYDGGNRTEVVEDHDLGEEDDQIRSWRMYMK